VIFYISLCYLVYELNIMAQSSTYQPTMPFAEISHIVQQDYGVILFFNLREGGGGRDGRES
jgi:hypothetical protein